MTDSWLLVVKDIIGEALRTYLTLQKSSVTFGSPAH